MRPSLTKAETTARVLENVAFSIRARGAYREGTRLPLTPVLTCTNAARAQMSHGSSGAGKLEEARAYLLDYLHEQRTRRQAPANLTHGLPLDIPADQLKATAARYRLTIREHAVLCLFETRYRGSTYTYELNEYDQPPVWELSAVDNRQIPERAARYWRRVQMNTQETHGTRY